MVTAIVGGNWGDEGKGKMTDLFAEEADIVVRFQGGANAGHTIINEYGKYALHMLPSGVFRQNVTNVIAQGVALNLDSLFHELDALKKGNVPDPTLAISDRTQIVMPYHVRIDQLEEQRLGAKSFGSTKSGIAPFYSDKYLKIGFEVSDIFGPDLKDRLEQVVTAKNISLKALYPDAEPINTDQIHAYLIGYKDRIEPFIRDTTALIQGAIREGKNVLLEGQLGALRDPDNGIYPFVTSSSPLAGFASVGAGIPPHEIKRIVTVVKAYSSCVGAGAFVTEIFGDEANELRNRGGDAGEYGATTGRPRRMGWFDAVASRYGCILQGTTDVALSLLDVPGYLDTIPVCTAYEIDGQKVTSFPVTHKLNRAKPVYEYLSGWKCDIRNIREYKRLPDNVRRFVEFVEEKLGYPITILSNGAKRHEVIYR